MVAGLIQIAGCYHDWQSLKVKSKSLRNMPYQTKEDL
jgi:drug/metabolite transporter superfamily protein YnfA